MQSESSDPFLSLVPIKFSQTFFGNPVLDGCVSESVMHGLCNAKPMATFPAKQHHLPLTKLHCLVNNNGVD